MTTNFPNDYDTFENNVDDEDIIYAADVNNLQDATLAIEQTLGKNPQGVYESVAERLTNSLGASANAVFSSITLATTGIAVSAVGDITTTGDVSGGFFYGDGGNLSGVHTVDTLQNITDNGSTTTNGISAASLQVDNLNLNGNTLSSTSGAVTITPLAGQNLNISLATTGDFAVNTNQLYVDTSAGNVGIGTTNPGAKLEVTGATLLPNNTALQFKDVSGTAQSILYVDTNNDVNISPVSSAKDIIFLCNPRVVIKGDGNVGIGTTAPGSSLEVRKDQAAATYILVGNATPSGTSGIRLQQRNAANDGTYTNLIYTSTLGSLIMGDDSSNGICVKYGGNVGIGTTGPTSKLDVVGTSTKVSILDASGYDSVAHGGGILLQGNFTGTGVATFASIKAEKANTTYQRMQGNLNFKLNRGTIEEDMVSVLFLQNDGNVGIGTTNPGTKLVVYGTPYVNQASSSQATFSDNTPMAAGVGGGISFGFFGDASLCDGPYIKAMKTNGTNANYSCDLSFGIRKAAGTISEAMRIDGLGNVGIGTTAPQCSFQVGIPSVSDATTQVAMLCTAATAGTVATGLHLDGRCDTAFDKGVALSFGRKSTGGNDFTSRIVHYGYYNNQFGSKLQIQTHSDTQNVWNTGIMIDNAGNVGIGTTTTNNGGWGNALSVQSESNVGIEVCSNATLVDSMIIGGLDFIAVKNTSGKEVAQIGSKIVGSTAGNRGASLGFWVKPDGGAIIQKMIIDSNGNVGINTIVPTQKLQVEGVIAQPPTTGSVSGSIFRIKNSSGNDQLEFGLQANSPYGAWIQASNAAILGTTFPICINPVGGNVGIGVTDPDSLLEIYGTGNNLKLSYDATHAATLDTGATGALTITPQAGTNLNVSLGAAGDFAVNTDDLVVDTSTGRVGIGTAAPATTLHVQGDQLVTGNISVSGNLYVTGVEIVSSTETVSGDHLVGGGLTVNGNTQLGNASTDTVSMSGTLNVQSGKLVVDSSTGRVGIGSATPTTALDVNGTVTATGLALGANNLTMTGTIASSSNRVTKGWFTDIDVSNAISASVPASALTGTTLASGVTGSSLTSVGTLTNLTVSNPISGSVTGSAGSAPASALTGTTLASGVTGSSLTSVGTLTALQVDNLNLNGNTVSSTSGAISIVPIANQNLNITLSTSGDFTVNTSDLYVDTSTSRVGIGTATPVTTLDVNGSVLSDRGYYQAANDWAISYDSIDTSINSLCVYNGKLYAGSDYSSKIYVYDGTTWSTSYDGTEYINSLCVYNGKLYAGSTGSGIILVYDGTTWSTSYDSAATYIYSLCVYNGKLYAGSGEDGVVYVYDGTTWLTSYNSPNEARIYSLCAYNGKLYAGTYGGGLVYVYDGTTWSTSYDSAGAAISSLCAYNGKLYAGSDGIIFVYDGTTWSTSYNGTETYIHSLCAYNGKLYAGSGTHGIVYVYDGTTWSTSYDSSESNILALCAYNGRLYAGSGTDGVVYVYSDYQEVVKDPSILIKENQIENYHHTWTNKNVFTSNVGIGTATPATALDVNGTVTSTGLALGANNLTMTGSIASSGSRVAKGWFTDLDVTNGISASVAASALTGTTLASGVTGSSLTSVGTLTALTVDNLNLNGNTLSSTSGAVTITPLAGQNLNISLATTGDFAVNTNQLYVDTSAGFVGIGTTNPSGKLQVVGGNIVIDSTKGLFASNDTYYTYIGGGSTAAGGAKLELCGNGYGTVEGDLYLIPGVGNNSSLFGTTQILTPTEALIAQFGSRASKTDTRAYFAGNVGIGTTSPANPLHVVSSTSGKGLILVGNTAVNDSEYSQSTPISFYNYNSTAVVASIQTLHNNWFNNLGKLSFSTSGSPRMLIDQAGNVGIGTTGPTTTLEVRKDQAAATYILVGNATPSGTSGIRLQQRNAVNDGTYTNLIYTSTLGSLIMGDNDSNGICVKYGGNVGIGTTGPTSKLDVVGTSTKVSILDASGYDSVAHGGGILLQGNFTGTGVATFASIKAEKANTTYQRMQGNLNFKLNRGTIEEDMVSVLFLQNDGNVGIGTTNPGTKLVVYGTPYVNQASSSQATFSDNTPMAAGVGGGISFGFFGDASLCDGPYIKAMKTNGTNANYSCDLSFGIRKAAGTISEAMRIDGLGNVGIGTTAPQCSFQVGIPSVSDATTQVAMLCTAATAGTVATGLHLDGRCDTAFDKGVALSFGRKSTGGNDFTSRIVHYGYYNNQFGSKLQIQTHSDTQNVWNTGIMIDNAGNVGIGTTTTNNGGWGNALSVQSESNVGIEVCSNATLVDSMIIGGLDFIAVKNTSGKEVAQIGSKIVGSTAGNRGASLGFWVKPDGGAIIQKMIIDSNGNVGINTIVPTQKLQVEGVIAQPPTTGSVSGSIFRIKNSSGNDQLEFGLQANSPYGAWIQASNAAILGTTFPICINPVGGNVGIGVTDPDSLLEVYGTGNNLKLSYDATHAATLDTGSTGALTITPQAGTNLNVALGTNGDFAVNTDDLVVDTSEGRVGIGTATPATTLDVNGSIKVATDIYTIAFTDYSSTASPGGWSSPTTKVYFKKIGKMVFVQFSIDGTSNANTAYFSLPFTPTGLSASAAVSWAYDNGAFVTSPVFISTSGGTCFAHINASSTGWTTSARKAINGQFFYETV